MNFVRHVVRLLIPSGVALFWAPSLFAQLNAKASTANPSGEWGKGDYVIAFALPR